MGVSKTLKKIGRTIEDVASDSIKILEELLMLFPLFFDIVLLILNISKSVLMGFNSISNEIGLVILSIPYLLIIGMVFYMKNMVFGESGKNKNIDKIINSY